MDEQPSESFMFDTLGSELDNSEYTLGGQDLVSKLIEIIQLTNLKDEFVPKYDEVDNIFQGIDGSEEFVEWFYHSISSSNVVSPNEFQASEECALVSEEEIDKYLEIAVGIEEGKVPLTNEMLDKLIVEEDTLKAKLSAAKLTHKILELELCEKTKNTRSLERSNEFVQNNLSNQLSAMSNFCVDCQAKADQLFDEIKSHLFLPMIPTCAAQLLSSNDLSSVIEVDVKLWNEILSLLERLFEEFNKKSMCNFILLLAMKKKENGVSESMKPLLGEYMMKVKSKLESLVDKAACLRELANGCNTYDTILSVHLLKEAKLVVTIVSLVKHLLSDLKKVEGCCDYWPAAGRKTDDSWASLRHLPLWHQAFTGRPADFVTVEEFSLSLSEFESKLSQAEINIVQYLTTLNQDLVTVFNNIVKHLKNLNSQSESDNVEVKTLLECRAKINQAYELIEKSNMKSQKMDMKSTKEKFEATLLLSLTDPQQFVEQVEEIQKKVDLLEHGFQME